MICLYLLQRYDDYYLASFFCMRLENWNYVISVQLENNRKEQLEIRKEQIAPFWSEGQRIENN